MHVRLIIYSAAGVVLRAFLNGTEVAVKRPKFKITLRPSDLKKFTQEVSTMVKASGPLLLSVFVQSAHSFLR
jgi:hypothetical protein